MEVEADADAEDVAVRSGPVRSERGPSHSVWVGVPAFSCSIFCSESLTQSKSSQPPPPSPALYWLGSGRKNHWLPLALAVVLRCSFLAQSGRE